MPFIELTCVRLFVWCASSAFEARLFIMVTYVAVHGGAGVHARHSDPDVKRSLRLWVISSSTFSPRSHQGWSTPIDRIFSACASALQALDKEPSRSLDAVEMAVSVMEDSPFLNAGAGPYLTKLPRTGDIRLIIVIFKGHGSNLTLLGTVECDASIMDGPTGNFGSVGAVSGEQIHAHLSAVAMPHSAVGAKKAWKTRSNSHIPFWNIPRHKTLSVEYHRCSFGTAALLRENALGIKNFSFFFFCFWNAVRLWEKVHVLLHSQRRSRS
jgi:hypothetical protein